MPPFTSSASRAVIPPAALLAFVFAGWLAAQDQKPGYAGTEMCQACHEDIYKSFEKNRHFALESDKKRGWESRSCESCHGPGEKHAESASAADILNPSKLPPARVDKDCLQCHIGESTNAGRIHGGHARNQISCVNCHSVHKPPAAATVPALAPALAVPPKAGKAARQNQQCASCHLSEWASFQKPHAHQLAQGAMSCVDCHNPHGSLLARSMRTVNANEPGCFRCHTDKRGPFLFEHAPMRVEGCGACHEPHGSSNPRMLTRHEVAFQCLECHANLPTATGGTATGALGGVPPAFHDLRNPRIRNCTSCHMKIHGSNVNRDFLR